MAVRTNGKSLACQASNSGFNSRHGRVYTTEKNASNQSGGWLPLADEKNSSNQSGGSFVNGEVESTVLGCGNNMFQYPSYTSSSKKVTRTTTFVREYEKGELVKETETIVEVEESPTYSTNPYQPYVIGTYN